MFRQYTSLAKRKKKFSVLGIILLLFTLGGICTSPDRILIAESFANLVQLPPESTDFPDKNPNASQFCVLKVVVNSIGWYQINGEIINLSNKTLFYPNPILRLFDKDNGPIGTITSGLVVTSELPPHTSAKFDITVNPVDLLGKPESYRLSFTGTFK